MNKKSCGGGGVLLKDRTSNRTCPAAAPYEAYLLLPSGFVSSLLVKSVGVKGVGGAGKAVAASDFLGGAGRRKLVPHR